MRCEGGVALHALVIRDKTGHDMKAVWAERAGGEEQTLLVRSSNRPKGASIAMQTNQQPVNFEGTTVRQSSSSPLR